MSLGVVMKFKITKLKSEAFTGQYGPTTKYNFQNAIDHQWYSAFNKYGFTEKFSEGFEFEADYTTKPGKNGTVYRNIQWPKQERGPQPVSTPTFKEQGRLGNPQLDRIEKKLDKIYSIILVNSPNKPEPVTDAPSWEGIEPPSDEDMTF